MLRLAALFALLAAAPALAQEAEAPPSTMGAFFGRIANAVAPRAPEKPTADFVIQSRRDNLDYRPFDPTLARADRRKTADEMARVTSQLEAAAVANRRKAARVKVPD